MAPRKGEKLHRTQGLERSRPGLGRALGACAAVLGLAGTLTLAIASTAPAASGPWERTWGTDVLSGGGNGFEICTAAVSCRAGVIEMGGEMNGPTDAASSPSGSVYVADSLNHRIQKFDSDGTWERTWGKDVISGGETGFEVCTTAMSCKPGIPGSLGGELWAPAAVATDAAGNVYVSDEANHRIQKFDVDGNFLSTWGKDVDSGGGTGFEICTMPANCKFGAIGGLGGELSANPRGLATDGTGDVHVADQGNNRIQRFDSNGNFERAWGKDVVVGGVTGFEVCVAGVDTCQAGTGGGLGGEMNGPVGVASNIVTGKVYVADLSNNRIQRFDSNGNFERGWGKDVAAAGPGNTGVGFEVCVAGVDTCQAGTGGDLGGEMNFPRDVATDGSGMVYVADPFAGRIQKFDADGDFERTWGKDVIEGGAVGDTGAGFEVCTEAADCKDGEIGGLGGEMGQQPTGLGADGAGIVYVADASTGALDPANHRIQSFDSNGSWQRAWGRDVIQSGGTGDVGTRFEICTSAPDCKSGTAGGLGGEMSGPVGVATDGAGNVYVADQGNLRIQKLDSAGNFMRAWGRDVVRMGAAGDTGAGFEICTAAADCQSGRSGDLGGEMSTLLGIATDGLGNLYVAENARIQKFNSNGAFDRAWGRDVISPGGGTEFEVCTVPADCRRGTPGGLGGELNGPTGLATDGAGKVYVADQMNHRIQRFNADGTWERAWGKDVIDPGAPGDTNFEICMTAVDCKIGATGALGGEMRQPTDLATDGSGNVYVADRFNVRMQKFDSDGTWKGAWGKDVSTLGGGGYEVCPEGADAFCQAGDGGGFGGEFNGPRGVATDLAGKVYVVDQFKNEPLGGNRRIQRFTPNGDWELAWGRDVVTGGGTGFEICTVAASCKPGTVGSLGGEMNEPFGIATDAAGNAYLADQGNQRIQRFADPVASPPPGGAGAGTGGASLAAPPSNLFEFGKLLKNKKKGIAFLLVNVPGPGELGLSGKGVQEIGGAGIARKSLAVSGGAVKLKIKPGKGRKARKLVRRLRERGKAKLKVQVTYVPTGGIANTQARKLKLVRR